MFGPLWAFMGVDKICTAVSPMVLPSAQDQSPCGAPEQTHTICHLNAKCHLGIQCHQEHYLRTYLYFIPTDVQSCQA